MTTPTGPGVFREAGGTVQDLDGEDLTTADTCLMDKLSVRQGESGQSVTCLQQALTEQGFYTGPISGQFDGATFTAVEAMQTDRNLYVDWIEVEGPLDVTGENPLRERILICDPATGAECVRQILSTFAERASLVSLTR